MAINISPLLKDHNLRPYHLSVLAGMYTGQIEDSYTLLDQSALKGTVKTNIHTLVDASATAISGSKASAITTINALIDGPLFDGSSLSSDNAASLKASIDDAINSGIVLNATSLKNNIDTEIDAVADNVSINKSDLLAVIKAELNSLIAADTDHFTYVDSWCRGAGQYEKRRDAGADPTDTSLKHCDVCDGFGRKQVQDEIIIIKPPVTMFP